MSGSQRGLFLIVVKTTNMRFLSEKFLVHNIAVLTRHAMLYRRPLDRSVFLNVKIDDFLDSFVFYIIIIYVNKALIKHVILMF